MGCLRSAAMLRVRDEGLRTVVSVYCSMVLGLLSLSF